ncbi:MAG TPA: GGDEF domain-containing protein [Actinoplanes sp.]|jgi:GGDEF domain-containing protein
MDRRDRGTRRREGSVPTVPRPPIPPGLDPDALAAAHEATRALLRADSPRDVVDIVLNLVAAVGARVVPARLASTNELPLDLSFGVGEPMLAQADPAGVPRLHLEILLPTFVADARQVVMALRYNAQLHDEAATDRLTGLLNRRSWDRQVYRLRAGDTVALLEFEGFEALIADQGQRAGDAVLEAFGPVLRDFLGADDLAARHGAHRLALGTAGGNTQLLDLRLQRLHHVWAAVRPHPVTFLAGMSAIDTTAVQAVAEARHALAAAKLAGHDRTQVIA